MVDAAAKIERASQHDAGAIAPEVGHSVAVASGPDALTAYCDFLDNAICGPAQTGSWVSNWHKALGADVLVATVHKDGMPLLALALEVCDQAGFREAVYVGGSHANGNFAALSKTDGNQLPADLQRYLGAAIGKARPDIDIVLLERQEPEICGYANPLIGPTSRPSPNIALASDLSGGFDAFLSRHSGKRKRKKHRSQARKFERHGGHQYLVADTPEDVVWMLETFFTVKGERFAALGIDDVFADPRVRDFFKALFVDALGSKDLSYVVHGLTIGDNLCAITGSSICGNRMICEFSGFADTSDDNISPGEFLFFENIQWACEKGLTVHDFSVGDEAYKRHWCSIETVQYDTLIALTLKGRIAARALWTLADAKRRLKSTPALWKAVKALRQVGRGKKSLSGG